MNDIKSDELKIKALEDQVRARCSAVESRIIWVSNPTAPENIMESDELEKVNHIITNV